MSDKAKGQVDFGGPAQEKFYSSVKPATTSPRRATMSDTKLKVGDVCREFSDLAAGMTIQWQSSTGDERTSKLERLSDHGNWVDLEGCIFRPWYVREHGVTILALPEEAQCHVDDAKPMPVAASGSLLSPVAPSLDAVPVGSRWRLNAAELTTFRVVFAAPQFSAVSVKYDGMSTLLNLSLEWVLAHATRIDEPAGTGLRFTCSDDNCALPGYHTGPHSMRGVPFTAPAAAMPPARCAPRPFKAHPYCMESHAIESNCVSCEELIAAETNPPPRMELVEVPAEPRLSADQAEARAMRDQRWEAMNASPMVGRYRFDRRPR